jgi:NAD(P)-dependent dehydrogenase (short-subunit alcohol dehydrogenase family)
VSHGRSVLISGASTGIGAATALRLAARGWQVYAGVRRERDGDALVARANGTIVPVMLDVTHEASIAAAVAAVRERAAGATLDAVINNAGIAIPGPLEALPDDELRRQFDVNFFGAIALARATLGDLRASRGRLINVSSIAGKSALPFAGAYSASKFALEAASDALRIELAPSGIRVILIEPGAIKTPIWDRAAAAADALFARASDEHRTIYGDAIDAMQTLTARIAAQGSSARAVADAIVQAAESPNPRARYLIGIATRLQLVMARLPEPMRDFLFSYSLGMTEGQR